MEQLKWVFENMKGSRWKFFLGAFLQICVKPPLVIIPPMIITELVEQVFTNKDTTNASFLIWMFLGISALSAIVHYTTQLFLDWAAADCLVTLRTKLYAKLQSLSPSYYNRTRTGDIMTRLTGDLEEMRHFVAWVITAGIYAVVLFIAGVSVFYATNAVLATILLSISPVMAFLVLRMRRLVAPAHWHVREMSSKLNATVQEYISGNRVVKAFVREDYEQEKFEKHNKAFRDASVKTATIYASYGPFFGACIHGVMTVTIIVGGIMVVNGQLTMGQLLLFFNLNWLVNDSMRLIGLVINDGQRFFSSTQKVMQLYYARADIKNGNNPYIEDTAESTGQKRGKVEFVDVEFKYDRVPVLKNINIVAEPGQTIGIMGPTGSGKTTLVMLMARFMDVSRGSIKIDGVDVRDYDLHTLRRKIGIAMQDVFLFSNTIDANISYGRPDMSEEEVKHYARIAGADEFIEQLPEGYGTIIGERGVGLSGGQKQRVALARALAYDSPILVLDDTTSAVDMETEKYIQDQLSGQLGRCTTFIIAQRISSVRNADMIYIIDNGEVVEQGTHEQLLQKKGYYYDIYCLQQGIDLKGEIEGVRSYV